MDGIYLWRLLLQNLGLGEEERAQGEGDWIFKKLFLPSKSYIYPKYIFSLTS